MQLLIMGLPLYVSSALSGRTGIYIRVSKLINVAYSNLVRQP